MKLLSHVRLIATPLTAPTRLLRPWIFQARVLEWGASAFSSTLYRECCILMVSPLEACNIVCLSLVLLIVIVQSGCGLVSPLYSCYFSLTANKQFWGAYVLLRVECLLTDLILGLGVFSCLLCPFFLVYLRQVVTHRGKSITPKLLSGNFFLDSSFQ